MGEVIVVTSGKGGVGKTTITANLSIALAKLGLRVIAVDTDIGLRNLDVVMGLENRITYNLVDVIKGKCRLKQAIIRDEHHDNMFLLPSAQSKDKTCICVDEMIELTNMLKERFDYVLIDCPAGIEQGFKNAIAGATTAIVVTTPEISSIRDADRIKSLLTKDGVNPIYLLVNRVRPDLVKKGEMMSSKDVHEILGLNLIGELKDDVNVVIATNRGESILDSNLKTANTIFEIAKKISGKTTIDADPKISHFFLKNLFSRRTSHDF